MKYRSRNSQSLYLSLYFKLLLAAIILSLAACSTSDDDGPSTNNDPLARDLHGNPGDSDQSPSLDLNMNDTAGADSSDMRDDNEMLFSDLPPGDFPMDTIEDLMVPYDASPVIDVAYPQQVISNGLIYIFGSGFTRPTGEYDQTEVWVISEDGSLRFDMEIVTGTNTLLVVRTPGNFYPDLDGSGTLWVSTPVGADDYSPVFASEENGFTSKTEVGAGLHGNVYQLQPNTSALPNMDTPCTDPVVLNTPESPCPFTTVVAANLDIPVRDFSSGFPGLAEDLLEWFAIRFEGLLIVETPGLYQFEICSDDGSNLYLELDAERQLVLGNDGLHSWICVSGTIELPAGNLPLTVDYYQGPMTEIGLTLAWTTPDGGALEIVPETHLLLFEPSLLP
jgi:hypothetical protein